MKNNTKPATAPKEGAVAKPETNKPATAPKEGAVAETITAEGVKVDTATGEIVTHDPKLAKLEEEIKQLKAQLRQEPQTIEERIAYYHRKEELAERYKSYNSMIAHIEGLIEKVEEENAEVADFADTREVYRLRLVAPNNYKDETVLSVSNKELINSILVDLKSKMEAKAEQLSKDLAA